MESGRVTREAMEKGLERAYRNAGMSRSKDADAVAKAVLRRAEANDIDMDTNLANLLNADGVDFLRRALRDDGVDESSINGIVDRLTRDRKKTSQEGYTKKRNSIDIGTAIDTEDGSDLAIVDLLSNDVHGDWQRYTRSVSGAAALARNNIRNRRERAEVISAVQAEQRALGEEVTDARELQAMFSAFDAGATKGWSKLAGGGDPADAGALAATLKRMVNLAWLNKLGLTQLGETAAVMSQVGMVNFWKAGMEPIWNKAMRENREQVLQEMSYTNGKIGYEHKWFAEHKNLDEMSDLHKGDLLSKIANATAKPSFIQGYISMFNTIRTWQQKTAALGMANKVFLTIRDRMDNGGLTDLEKARFWGDFGIDDNMLFDFENMIRDGKVEFAEDGSYVNRLHMDKWDDQLAENFGSSITRNVNQTVQKAMSGETDTWMHSGWGSIMTQLGTFPMVAVQKQFVRNFRHGDPQAIGALVSSMSTAMVASYVKSAATIGDREMSVKDHAKRAFQYSNMTGFIPMGYDPLMTAIGLDDYRINQFDDHHTIMPPSLAWLNDAKRLPGAVAKTVTGNGDYSTKRALRTLPFSNSFIFGDLIVGIGQKDDEEDN